MAKPIVQVTGLTQLTKRMAKLRTTLPTEIQTGLDDTAGATLTGLGRELNKGIQDPSDWIRVRPKSANSSIVASKPAKGRARGDAEAEIRVADKQSAVLKFGLAGETVRRAGDVGVGSRMLWVGQEKALQDAQGIRMTPEGVCHRAH